jgi:hypothetical protein
MNYKYLNKLIPFIIFLIILNIGFLNKLHSQQFKTYHFEELVTYKTPKDSTLLILNNTREKALLKNDTISFIKSLISISAFNRYHLKYNQAFKIAGEALFIAEEFRDSLLEAKAYEELGVLSYLYKQHNDAKDNFIKSHSILKKLFAKKIVDDSEMYQSHYNLVMYYQGIRDAKNLAAHIDSCLTIGKKIMKDDTYKVYLNEKKSSIIEWKDKNKETLSLLIKSANELENLKITSEIQKNKKSFLLILYGRIAILYMKLNNLDLAKTYFEKSVRIENITGEATFYRAYLYSRYALTLSKKELYDEAYKYEQKSNEMGNTYLNPRNARNKGFLTIKNRYKDEIAKKNTLLNSKNLEISDKKAEILRFQIFFVIALLLITFIGFMIRSRIRSLKHEKSEQNSKDLLDIKNKELTTSTLQLIEKEEIVKTLKDHIKKSDIDSSTKALLKSIDNSSTSLWDSFNSRFSSLNKGFYERLQLKVPDLTSSDLKICALIKLNFSGKEMAHLLGISLGSVHVARHRLRKKMKLERNQNLTSFITTI